MTVTEPDRIVEQLTTTFSDGSELLVECWTSGRLTAALRHRREGVWGPPADLHPIDG